jgi:hypothetical protein
MPENEPSAVKKLCQLAREVQHEISTFQPDVLVILARGGFGPLWALQALWDIEPEAVHPPIAVTNLGREKLSRYEHHRLEIGVSFMPGFEPFDFFGDCERGYFHLASILEVER